MLEHIKGIEGYKVLQDNRIQKITIMTITNVTPENAEEETFFCIKNTKNPGFIAKQNWFNKWYAEGLRIKILKNNEGKQAAFIEYIPADFAWRPVNAPGYMFIQCMFTYSNNDKGKGYGSLLIKDCEEDAKQRSMSGVAVMTSKGTWVTDKRIFENNGYQIIDKKGWFELLVKKFNDVNPDPKLIDWTENFKSYKWWHLLYSDQCPWHYKFIDTIKEVADENNLKLTIKKITRSEDAKQVPSGFGVFNIIHNGKLTADHYISRARFNNILKNEL